MATNCQKLSKITSESEVDVPDGHFNIFIHLQKIMKNLIFYVVFYLMFKILIFHMVFTSDVQES